MVSIHSYDSQPYIFTLRHLHSNTPASTFKHSRAYTFALPRIHFCPPAHTFLGVQCQCPVPSRVLSTDRTLHWGLDTIAGRLTPAVYFGRRVAARARYARFRLRRGEAGGRAGGGICPHLLSGFKPRRAPPGGWRPGRACTARCGAAEPSCFVQGASGPHPARRVPTMRVRRERCSAAVLIERLRGQEGGQPCSSHQR
jgi:hypothetical protein